MQAKRCDGCKLLNDLDPLGPRPKNVVNLGSRNLNGRQRIVNF